MHAKPSALPTCLLCAQVKLALSRRLCGLLIGQKGQTVGDDLMGVHFTWWVLI